MTRSSAASEDDAYPRGRESSNAEPIEWEEASTIIPAADAQALVEDRAKKFSETWATSKRGDGESLGNYHRLERVGAWRFGTLLEAEHSPLRRPVRLITLDAPWSGNPSIKRWFLSRTGEIAKIHVPTVCSSVLECVEVGDVIFLALPQRNVAGSESLRRCAAEARLSETTEPLSQAFYLLFDGLRVFHEQGVVHGDIDTCHIALSDDDSQIQFDPFAKGVPGADAVQEDGCEFWDRDMTQRCDGSRLARAFLAALLQTTIEEIPDRVSRSWIQKRLPFVPARLASFLASVSRHGLQVAKSRSELYRLHQIRHEPLSEESWGERFRNLLMSVLCMLVFGMFLLPAFVLLKPEIGGRDFVPMVLATLVATVVLNTILEVVFGKSVPRSYLGYTLVNEQGIPCPTRSRSIRAASRIGVLLVASFALSLVVSWSVSLLALWTKVDRSDLDLGWPLYGLISLIASTLVVYATSFAFRGRPFHDWISGTRWVHHRTTSDVPVLMFEPAAQTDASDVAIASPARGMTAERAHIEGIQIEQELGVGGMGVVYRGTDESLQRPVALKVVTEYSVDADEVIRRFRREARLGSILNHPNIARVYKVGLWEGRPFMAMEFVDGQNLQQIVKGEGPIPIARAWAWIRQAALGLQQADEYGIIHRDIKPANLMVTKDGVVKLMDFGISKSVNSEDTQASGSSIAPPSMAAPSSASSISSDAQLTRVGAMLGTPGYMSPEQARCEPMDRRSDIYSLGLTLYFLLAGRSAYGGSNAFDLMMQQASQSPPPLPSGILERSQRQVLEKMLALATSDRFQDYSELIHALDQNKPDEMRLPNTSRRITAIAIDFSLLLIMSLCLRPFQNMFQSMYEAMRLTVSMQDIVAITNFAAIVAYFVGFTVWLGGTPGQWLLGLRVLRHDGRKVGWRGAILRMVAKYPVILWSYFFALPFLLRLPEPTRTLWSSPWTLGIYVTYVAASLFVVNANFATHRKAIHDYIAGTRIVYARKGWLDFDLRKLFG